MSEQSSRAGPGVADDLDVHLIEFLAALAKAGYAESTQCEKERLIAPFLRRVRRLGIPLADLDEASIDAFLACSSRRRSHRRTALQQFVEHLRNAGAVAPRRSRPSFAEKLVCKYIEHLRDKQGLSPHSIAVYSPFARAFVVAQRLPGNAAVLDRLAVGRYQLDVSHNRSASFVRLLAAALRSFLRFCFLDGITAADLSTAVHPIRRWQLAAIPPSSLPTRSSG